MNKREQKPSLSLLAMLGNIISWTMLVLLILVAAFLLYYIISTQLYATKGEKFAPKYSLYTIVSPSMTPNINVYDIVIDKKVDDFSQLKVGDVITFISTSSISNGMTITHRIVDIIETDEGTKYKTKGDNNLTADYALVTQDKIIGKVKLRIPQLGRIQFFLSSKGGWLIIILIPALIIILNDIFKLTKFFGIKKRVKNIEDEDNEEEKYLNKKKEIEAKKQQELKERLQAKIDNSNEESETLNKQVDEYINNIETEETNNINLEALKAMLDDDNDEEVELPKTIEIKEEEIPDDLELPTMASSNKEEKDIEENNYVDDDTNKDDVIDSLESVIDDFITKEKIINIEDIDIDNEQS